MLIPTHLWRLALLAAFLLPIRPERSLAGPVSPPAPPPFHWIEPAKGLPAPAAEQPKLPDLSVQWIERTPRYPRFCLDYRRGLPELCPGTEEERRFPDPGEIISLTAHIANQGMVASTAISATWTDAQASNLRYVDVPPLAPGVTTTLALTLPWPASAQTITLSLDPAGALAETTRSNNQRSHWTGALYLEILVHPYIDAAFAGRENLAGSWSFADWIQAQFEALNANLAGARYPTSPSGVPDRARIDRILVTEAVGGDIVASTLDFDGRWTFRVETDDPDTAENEGQLSAETYARAFARQIDWGLIHELTHQLGAIDLYQLNVAGSYQNELLDGDGRPLLLGFQWPNPGLMGGGDRGAYPWPAYSQHTAAGLSSNAGQRRGYYGDYLFDLPATSSLRALDNRGQPLAGAQIDLFQTEGRTLRAQPVASGLLDEQGRFQLPQRALPAGGLTTATGHTLAANPFGLIDVAGFNGQLLVRISRSSSAAFRDPAAADAFYAWWPIHDFNLAAWQGIAAYERTIATHLPPAGAPPPPVRLDGLIDGRTVSLNWPASPWPGVIEYQVYRGQEPDFYPFELVAATSGLNYQGTLERTARFAVTAVDGLGRKSGYSPIFRAQRTISPVGVVIDPASGLRTILDRHDGALIRQLADGRWIGRQGTVHAGLTGSEALSRNQAGQLLVAVTGEDRVKALDGDGFVINWFGRERFVESALKGPAGIAQADEVFTVDLKPAEDASTLGLASFDGAVTLSGESPSLLEGVTLVDGRFDGAILVDENDRLRYRAAGHFLTGAGSVELWVRPQWAWNDGEEHVFVEIGQVDSETPRFSLPGRSSPEMTLDRARKKRISGYRLRLAKADWGGLYAWLRDGPPGEGHDITLYAGIEDWSAGGSSWHHLAVVWQPVQPAEQQYTRYTLWVDGILQDSQVTRRPVEGPFDLLSVGAGLDGLDQADASLDELRISSDARLGNSRDVRLFISQGEANRIDVMDWLGNWLASYNGPPPDFKAFDVPRELALAGDFLLVADSGHGCVQIIDRVWPYEPDSWCDGLIQPHGLALLPGGHLLVSDRGDHQVKLLDSRGRLLRRWREPDSHPGSFWQPAGLALLPEGDILVADMGNGRVARIDGPLIPGQRYFPLMAVTDPPFNVKGFLEGPAGLGGD